MEQEILNVMQNNKIIDESSSLNVDLTNKTAYFNDSSSKSKAFCLSSVFRYLFDFYIEPMKKKE